MTGDHSLDVIVMTYKIFRLDEKYGVQTRLTDKTDRENDEQDG